MSPEVVQRLVREIEAKDMSTAAHTWRVVLYARAMMEEHGVDQETIALATQGAALHDIGKLDIPEKILQKPGKLTGDEFEVIKQHTVTGFARMVEMDVSDEIVLDLVRYHHERWDGMGYPFNLKGEEIPLVARHFAVIDTFDALTSHRPYRHEVGERAGERAVEILVADRGTHFWPDAVDMFVELYRSGRLAWILDHFNDGAAVPAYGDSPAEVVVRKLDRVKR